MVHLPSFYHSKTAEQSPRPPRLLLHPTCPTLAAGAVNARVRQVSPDANRLRVGDADRSVGT